MNSGERLIGEHEGLTVDPDQGGGLTADTLHPANAGRAPDDQRRQRGRHRPRRRQRGPRLQHRPGRDRRRHRGRVRRHRRRHDRRRQHRRHRHRGHAAGPRARRDHRHVQRLEHRHQQLGAVAPPNTATGVRLNNAGTVELRRRPARPRSPPTGAKGLDAIGTNMGSESTFDDITVSAPPHGGVNLLNTTGTTTFGDGTGTDLNLTTTSGSAGGFVVSNGGTGQVAAAGTDDVHATGGPAVDVDRHDRRDARRSTTSTRRTAPTTASTSTASAPARSRASSGDIAGAAGISFDLNGGSGAITYPGSLDNGPGTTAIEITGRTGGDVTLSGPISDTNDAGGGRQRLDATPAARRRLSNATKQFNTGAQRRRRRFANGSDGHTLNLSGGGLDIDTTTGNGLDATTGGTRQRRAGSGNTIDSTALARQPGAQHQQHRHRRRGRHVPARSTRAAAPTASGSTTPATPPAASTSPAAAGRARARPPAPAARSRTRRRRACSLNDRPRRRSAIIALRRSSTAPTTASSATTASGGFLLDRRVHLRATATDVNADNGGRPRQRDRRRRRSARSDIIGSGVINDGSSNLDVTNTTRHAEPDRQRHGPQPRRATDDGLQVTGDGSRDDLLEHHRQPVRRQQGRRAPGRRPGCRTASPRTTRSPATPSAASPARRPTAASSTPTDGTSTGDDHQQRRRQTSR